MKQSEEILIELAKYGLGRTTVCRVPQSVDWKAVFELAFQQEIAAIVLDGINRCYENGVKLEVDYQTKMEWIGSVSQMEQRYSQHEKAMQKLGQWYHQHGFEMMVLKGWGLSLNYPIHNHRQSGDLDIYLFGEQEKADKLIHDELRIEIDRSHHHHTVFTFQGESVENHYDFSMCM